MLLPQLALTLSNAVFATAALAADYFERRQAGLGAAAGIWHRPVQRTAGAGRRAADVPWLGRAGRTIRLRCANLDRPVAVRRGLPGARTLGAGAGIYLALIPLAAVGALLVVTGVELALSQGLFDIDRGSRLVVAATAIACVAIDMATGLVIGLALEFLRLRYRRRLRDS